MLSSGKNTEFDSVIIDKHYIRNSTKASSKEEAFFVLLTSQFIFTFYFFVRLKTVYLFIVSVK